ncbi:hypothetical protein LPJ75_003882 [Coemansia sp. RSA 2598]|nr:hypothetical protein LPJ75_003882 [Coemansia sp. RSA 2598]
MLVIPSINHDGSIKRCSNCKQTDTPSWRRHPETQDLLCNACGLYLRLHRKSRPIAFDDDGNVQVIRKNAAIRREPVNLGNHHGQIYPGGNGYHSMQFSPLPLALMPGYQQRVPAQTHELQQQQQQQLQPGAPGPAVSFADIQAMAEPFSSLTLATSMAGSAVSVGPSFGYFTQLDGMLAGGQLDAHRLQTQGNVVGVQVQEIQDMHPAFSTPPQSSPGLPNVSPGLVDWYSRGQDQGQGHDYQGFGRAHQIPLALTNGAEPPDLSYGNGESSVSLTPESNPSSSGFSTI